MVGSQTSGDHTYVGVKNAHIAVNSIINDVIDKAVSHTDEKTKENELSRLKASVKEQTRKIDVLQKTLQLQNQKN